MKSVRERNLEKTVALLHNIPKLCCQEMSALLPWAKLLEVVAAIFRRTLHLFPQTQVCGSAAVQQPYLGLDLWGQELLDV